MVIKSKSFDKNLVYKCSEAPDSSCLGSEYP